LKFEIVVHLFEMVGDLKSALWDLRDSVLPGAGVKTRQQTLCFIVSSKITVQSTWNCKFHLEELSANFGNSKHTMSLWKCCLPIFFIFLYSGGVNARYESVWW